MCETTLLTMLKADLEFVPANKTKDVYLLQLLASARQMIAREGVTLAKTEEDAQLIVMYAAYLDRSRADNAAKMPRMLRWAMNNRLFGQKMGGGSSAV